MVPLPVYHTLWTFFSLQPELNRIFPNSNPLPCFVPTRPPYLLNPAVHVQVDHPARGRGGPHDPLRCPRRVRVAVRVPLRAPGRETSRAGGCVGGSEVRQHPSSRSTARDGAALPVSGASRRQAASHKGCCCARVPPPPADRTRALTCRRAPHVNGQPHRHARDSGGASSWRCRALRWITSTSPPIRGEQQ